MSSELCWEKAKTEIMAASEDQIIALENEVNVARSAYLTKDDCILWAARAYWTAWQGSHLLFNLDSQKAFSLERGGRADTRTLAARVSLIMDAYSQRYRLGEIEMLTVPGNDIDHIEAFGRDTEQIVVRPKELLEWAKSKGLPIPVHLWSAVFGTEQSAEGQELESAPKSNYLKRSGDFWEIRYGESTLSGIKNMVGLTYLAELLRVPNQEIHVRKLSSIVSGSARDDRAMEFERGSQEEYGSMGMSLCGDSIPDSVLDKQASKAYKEELDRFEILIEQAEDTYNDVEVESLKRQRDFVRSQLLSAMDHKGQSRNFNDEGEKARKRVQKNISALLKKIEEIEQSKYRDKKVSAYLSKSIKTGYSCTYMSSEAEAWIVEK